MCIFSFARKFLFSFLFRYFYTKIYGMKNMNSKTVGMKKEYFNSRANINWIIIFETNVKYFIANYLISSQLYPFIPHNIPKLS